MLAAGVDEHRHRGSSRARGSSGRSPRPGPRRTGTGPGTLAGSRSASRGCPGVEPEEGDLLARAWRPGAWKNGNSSRHGPHHDAHLLTTTGWPSQLGEAALEGARAAAEQLGGLVVQRGQRRRRAGEPLARGLEVEARRRVARSRRRPRGSPAARRSPPRRSARTAARKTSSAAHDVCRGWQIAHVALADLLAMQGARGKVTQGESGCPPAPGSSRELCGAAVATSSAASLI